MSLSYHKHETKSSYFLGITVLFKVNVLDGSCPKQRPCIQRKVSFDKTSITFLNEEATHESKMTEETLVYSKVKM
jgi:hypothetical protein